MPGSAAKKWHAVAPPEIRAVSDSPEGVALQLVRLAEEIDEDVEEEIVFGGEDPEGVLVVDLAELELGPGSYRVDLRENGETASSTHFQLSSGDNPDRANWARLDPVHPDPAGPLGFLGVTSSDRPTPVGHPPETCPAGTPGGNERQPT